MIKGVNAHTLHGDAAGFKRARQVFESAVMADGARKASGEGEEGKEGDDAGASNFERTAEM